jgi:transcriptional regulator with XRE-family HTH domain
VGKKPRPRPERLAAKLLAIRLRLCYSQTEMVRLLNLKMSAFKYELTTARISEYELAVREPNLLTLSAYARAGDTTVDELIDDDKELEF